MTTPREIANTMLTAEQWVRDHADDLPPDFDFGTRYGPMLTWRGDTGTADYTRSYLERWFGPATEHSHAYTEADWEPEGSRPALRVIGVTIRERCYKPGCTLLQGHHAPHPRTEVA